MHAASTGEVKPRTVQRKDTNGVAVTANYTPNITPVKPTAKSSGVRRLLKVKIKVELQHSLKDTLKLQSTQQFYQLKLIDPKTGQPTDEKSVAVPGEGTYTVAEDGTA